MRVVSVTNFIPAGQFLPSDVLLDIQDRARPDTVGVIMPPLFEGGTMVFRAGANAGRPSAPTTMIGWKVTMS